MEKCNTEELYRLHRERLLSLINSKVEDSQKAEDLLHDSFIKLQTCCDQSCVCERPKSYLFRLAMNTVFDYFKKKRKSTSLSMNDSYHSGEVAMNKSNVSCDLLECITRFLKDTSSENRLAFTDVDLRQKPQGT